MIKFVENKTPTSRVESYLKLSANANHWANEGPVSLKLEQRITDRCAPGCSAVACNSGSSALSAIGRLLTKRRGHDLTWGISSFAHWCQFQYPFTKTVIHDCREDASLDPELLTLCDRYIVMDVFGLVDLTAYDESRSVYDCALTIDGLPPYSVTSFHHTKPWGFGEGGCAIVPNEEVPALRQILNFGKQYADEPSAHEYGFNGKMSDVSAAYIMDRMDVIEEQNLASLYFEQYERISTIAVQEGFTILSDRRPKSMPHNVPVLFTHSVLPEHLDNDIVSLGKYYPPLNNAPMAADIYRRIFNVPCHRELSKATDSELRQLFGTIANRAGS